VRRGAGVRRGCDVRKVGAVERASLGWRREAS